MEESLYALRVGTVEAVLSTNKVRVRVARCNGIVSKDMTVIQRRKTKIHIAPDGAHSHTCPDGTTSEEPDHSHHCDDEFLSYTTTWTPEVGDEVLCAMIQNGNGQGFVLGHI